MDIVKYNSLELNWMPNSVKKHMKMPQVVYVDNLDGIGAFYVRPQREPYLYDDIEVNAVDGLLVVGYEEDDDIYISSIAHEWRHHWQHHNGWTLDYGGGYDYDFSTDEIYKAEIVRYFTDNKHELDALLFETKIHPDYSNTQWLDWVKLAI